MSRPLLAVMLLTIVSAPGWSAQPGQVVPLWSSGAPGALGQSESDQPKLHLFTVRPMPGHKGMAVVVCPGGSYLHLAMDHEGIQVAEWLNSFGVSAYVLQYRLGPTYHYPIQLTDAQRAIRYVRAHSVDWGLDPDRIGILGFSAGGHLAATAATHADDPAAHITDEIDRHSARPDFVALAYPVITMKDPFAHGRSREALLGPAPSISLENQLSNELQVNAKTPPAFLFHTSDDKVVPVENSLLFYQALHTAGVPVELHVYPHGAHGAGLAQNNAELRTWPDLLKVWLSQVVTRR